MAGELDAVFTPRRVALVGASQERGKVGRLLWDNLASFPGEVVPVRAAGGTINGIPAYARLRDVPGEVDLVVVAVPAAVVPEVIEDAGAKGIPAAVVLSGGFAETGEAGRRLEAAVLTAAQAGGVRVIGPNGLGVQNCDVPLNASMAAGLPPGGGGISLVTQSGAYGMAIHTLGVEERARFAKLCSVGNQIDVTSAELLDHLAADPATAVVCFFLESLPDGRAFYEAARRATAHVPVVVARTGRSAAGARAARSHTAALADGDAAIERGALVQAGVIQVRSGLEMTDVARALATQPAPRGRRVGIVTNSGGTGVELTDLLAAEGLDVPALSDLLQAELAELLPAHGSPTNPVDVTPVWGRFSTLYPQVVDRLARSGEVDVVIPILLQRAAADAAVAAGLRDTVQALRAEHHPVPVYVCWVAPREARPNADLLQDAGIPCFDWPERTARAVAHAATHGTRVPRAAVATPHTATADPPPPGPVAPDRARRLLEDAGIPLVSTRTCATAELAAAAAPELGFPVVAKLSHPDVLHKSDIGGVRTGLPDVAAVAKAARELLALRPGGQVLLQPQLTGVELIIGGLRDPRFGPAVMVGVGGVFVEALADVTFGVAPLDDHDAEDLWHRLRAQPVLAGARGGPSVDHGALVAVTRRLGDLLVANPWIDEIDLNPVIATDERVTAVDWRLLAGDRGTGSAATTDRRR